MTSLRKILLAAPLLLALSACDTEETGDAALEGEAVARSPLPQAPAGAPPRCAPRKAAGWSAIRCADQAG